jgi:CopG family nickel-responsive transcriptional regulator
LTIISVSVPDELLGKLDSSIKKRGFASRSEILRQAIRAFMEEYRSLENITGEVTATVTVIYTKAAKNERMLSIQHEYENVVLTFLHTHVDEDNCLEVMVVKGPIEDIRKLSDALKANKDVKQIKVSLVGVSEGL